MNDTEQKIKEKLLEELISQMSSGMGDRMKPKAASVTVEAPDQEHLADGLDKAKDLIAGKDSPLDEKPGSDEDRMAALADDSSPSGSEDDEDDDKLAQLLESLHK